MRTARVSRVAVVAVLLECYRHVAGCKTPANAPAGFAPHAPQARAYYKLFQRKYMGTLSIPACASQSGLHDSGYAESVFRPRKRMSSYFLYEYKVY